MQEEQEDKDQEQQDLEPSSYCEQCGEETELGEILCHRCRTLRWLAIQTATRQVF